MPRLGGALDIVQVSDPATPATGRQYLYFKSDGHLYTKKPDGAIVQVDGAAGGTAANVVTSAGATANKLTSSPTASPPAAPVAGDLWLVTDAPSGSTPLVTTKYAALASGSTNMSPGSGQYEITDPQVVPMISTTFVPAASTVLLVFQVTGRVYGLASVSFQASVCLASLGRRPYPRTQIELISSPPAGITHYPLTKLDPGVEISPGTSINSGTVTIGINGGSMSSAASATAQLTGLTVGATYNLDISAGIVGAADYLTGLPAGGQKVVVSAQPSGFKVYVFTSGTTGRQVNVPQFLHHYQGGGAMTLGATITQGGQVYAAVVTPDQSKVLLGAYTVTEVQVLRVSDNTFLGSYATPTSQIVQSITVEATSTTAYVVLANNTIVGMTIATGAYGTPVAVGSGAQNSAIFGSTVWVLNNTAKTLTSYTVSGLTITATGNSVNLSAMTAPKALALSNDGTKAYITDATVAGGALYEADLVTKLVTRSINFGSALTNWNTVKVFQSRTNNAAATQTVLCFATAAGNNNIIQVNVTDWVIYTTFQESGPAGGGAISDATIGPNGDIFILDTTNNALDFFFSSLFGCTPGLFNTPEKATVTITPAS